MNFIGKLQCFDFIETTSEIWFSNRSFNGLFCIDKRYGEIRRIIPIPDESIAGIRLHSSIFRINNELINIPDHSNRIVCYHMEQDNFSSIAIDGHVRTSDFSNFRAAHQYGNNIIMFPNRADRIIIYDHIKKEIFGIDFEDDVLKKIYPDRGIQFGRSFSTYDGCIFVPFMEADAVLKVDPLTRRAEIKIIDGLKGSNAITYCDDTFYLMSWRKRAIYETDMDFHIKNIYSDFPRELEGDERNFAHPVLIKNKIYYFPVFGNMILSFNIEKKEIKEEMRIKSPSSNSAKTHFARLCREKIISLMEGDLWFSEWSIPDGNLHKKPYSPWNQEHNNRIIENYLIQNGYFNTCSENEIFRVSDYIDIWATGKEDIFLAKQTDQMREAGKRIYTYIA